MSKDLPDRIYLAGFMGSGKSTIAPLLAKALSYNVVDLDETVEQTAGKSIPQIFKEGGEASFRKLERQMLEKTTQMTDTVVSLGGGAVTFTPNLQLVRESGILVYLKVPVDQLLERLYGERGRPLLQDNKGELLSKEQLRVKVSRMLSEREPFYNEAQVVVDAGKPLPEETVQAILQAVSETSAAG